MDAFLPYFYTAFKADNQKTLRPQKHLLNRLARLDPQRLFCVVQLTQGSVQHFLHHAH